MALPNTTGTPSEQLPAIAEALTDDVHLYLDALHNGEADDAEQLLADLHQDWPAFLDRLLEQARLAHAEHAQARPGCPVHPGSPAGWEKWASHRPPGPARSPRLQQHHA